MVTVIIKFGTLFGHLIKYTTTMASDWLQHVLAILGPTAIFTKKNEFLIAALKQIQATCNRRCRRGLDTGGARGCTPLSSRTSCARQNNLFCVSCITKKGQNFINFFFMSRYTRYPLHSKRCNLN